MDGLDLATAIAKEDADPDVKATVVDALTFRRADRHVAATSKQVDREDHWSWRRERDAWRAVYAYGETGRWTKPKHTPEGSQPSEEDRMAEGVAPSETLRSLSEVSEAKPVEGLTADQQLQESLNLLSEEEKEEWDALLPAVMSEDDLTDADVREAVAYSLIPLANELERRFGEYAWVPWFAIIGMNGPDADDPWRRITPNAAY
jgi:hypothetical protein